jgi:proteasome lid subunit RPN8/RPN11
MLEQHHIALRQSVLRDDKEYGAYLLCGRSRNVDPWTGDVEERFLVRELVEVDEKFFLERTRTRMTWSTTPLFNLLKRAEKRDFGVIIVHSHPGGPLKFSEHDDTADREAFEIVFNRLDSRRPHLSAVMDGDGKVIARGYEPDLRPKDVELIRFIGNRWSLAYSRESHELQLNELDRQIRAFGGQSTRDITKLRIGIAGCGGTGSAIALLLARIGVRYLPFLTTIVLKTRTSIGCIFQGDLMRIFGGLRLKS